MISRRTLDTLLISKLLHNYVNWSYTLGLGVGTGGVKRGHPPILSEGEYGFAPPPIFGIEHIMKHAPVQPHLDSHQHFRLFGC